MGSRSWIPTSRAGNLVQGAGQPVQGATQLKHGARNPAQGVRKKAQGARQLSQNARHLMQGTGQPAVAQRADTQCKELDIWGKEPDNGHKE